MSHSHINKILILAFLALTYFSSFGGQKHKSSNVPAPGIAGTTSAQGREAASRENNWWAAQRSIEAAIQQLQAYLDQSPTGERAESARQQIAVLRDLTLSAARPEWATMDHQVPSRDVTEWRVSSIGRFADKTTITIEIRCKREDGEDCHFLSFQRHPLVLIDNAGRFYPMLDAAPLPLDIRFSDIGEALLAGGRILPLQVDFAPLAAAVVSGRTQYRDRNTADPARFSAVRQK
jgi:hypothetical protein